MGIDCSTVAHCGDFTIDPKPYHLWTYPLSDYCTEYYVSTVDNTKTTKAYRIAKQMVKDGLVKVDGADQYGIDKFIALVENIERNL